METMNKKPGAALEPVLMHDFLEYFTPRNPVFSPNGENVAFLVSKPNLATNSAEVNLWVTNHQSRELKKLTSLGDAKKHFFLNDREIVFEGGKARAGDNAPKGSRFYSISLDGGEAEFFMEIPFRVSKIKMIDSERYLVTTQFDNADPMELDENGRVKEKDSEKVKEKEKKDKNHIIFDEIPFWTDGGGIVNKKRERLYIFNKKENTCEPISEPFQTVVFFDATEKGVYYSASCHTDKYSPATGIYYYDFHSKKVTTLLDDSTYTVHFISELNGNVVFLGMIVESGLCPSFYTLKDKTPQILYHMENRVASGPVAKPDGIYFNTYDSGMELILFKIDGNGERHTVCHIEGDVSEYDISGDKIFCIAREKARLFEAYFIKNNGVLDPVSHFNADFFARKAVSIPEKISVQGEVLVEGYLVKPKDFDPTKKYPAILWIHGGPRAVYGCGYHHDAQFNASNGYFMFCCNHRGSDGYGNAHADIRGKYGIADYEDIMLFTEAVLEKYPQIDPNRMGVTGLSYGGYMTNWIITQTDRFKCAVSKSTISNLFTKGLTTDIGYFHNFHQQSSTPWDNPEKLWWHSPLAHADKVKTPTLFVQGEKDHRTWMVEAIQMFTALKYHGIESRMCMIFGETHGLSSKPASQATNIEESTAWFEKYLK